MSFHITLTTTDATFEKSSNNGLKLHFTKPIRLRGEWEVAIVNWISDDDDDDAKSLVWIFCDFVDYSLINNIPMQFLGIENDSGSSSSTKPMYVKVCKKMISNINIQIKRSPLAQELATKVKNFTCILHFRKA
jgi:hypothetical protein